MRDWIRRFGLSADPFDAKETPGFYYGGPYGVASLRLEQALRQRRGYVVVTGEAGLGKTSLVRSVLARREVFASAGVSCAEASPASVIEQMLLRAEPFAGSFSATRRRAALLSMVEQAKLADKPIVFIIEDAHLADPVQLEDLRVALTLDTAINDVVQVILVGRLKMTESLASRTLRELAAQVVATVTLPRMTTDEAVDFLGDRLADCGVERSDSVFTQDAIIAIARHSAGIITTCSSLARESLKRAADADAQVVTPDFVADAAAVFAPAASDESQVLRKPKAYRWLAGPMGAVAVILLLALAVAATQVNLMDPWAGEARDSGDTNTADAAVGTMPDFQLPPVQSASPKRLAGSPLRDKFLADTPYEVTITPPENPNASKHSKPTAGAGKARSTGGTAGQAPIVPMRPAAAAIRSAVSRGKATPRRGRIALQVAAFRNLDSADELKALLARRFDDVYVSKILSGGTPLYRVRVGNFREASETQPLRKRLQAAGYASFRVTE